MKRNPVVRLAVVAVLALALQTSAWADATAPENIILMIGDGMGPAQVTAAKIHAGELNMERLTSGGLQWTFAEGALVTDSAASGTALATGHKTHNGAVSVTSDGRPVTTVLEHAESRGMATGLVATCSITHATPAVFAAHVVDRSMDNEIARQMAESDIEVLFGGGRAYFTPRSTPGGLRDDGRDLLAELGGRSAIVTSAEEFRELGEVDSAVGLFARQHPGRADAREPSLVELTSKAIEILSRDADGFFLMVEGSQIDWAGHENDADYLVDEMMDFDAAVGAALDFAEQDGRTLVLVTADHECGGLAVVGGSLERREFVADHAGDNHTAIMVPILAAGPGSERFSGIIDNTDIGRRLIELVSGASADTP